MLRDSEFMRQVDEACQRIREPEREAARRREKASRRGTRVQVPAVKAQETRRKRQAESLTYFGIPDSLLFWPLAQELVEVRGD